MCSADHTVPRISPPSPPAIKQEKSDLKSSHAISSDMSNVRTTTLYGKTFYHTSVSEKTLLAKGEKYNPPSKEAFKHRKDGEFVIEAQSLSSNKRALYRYYGCLTLAEIRALAWGQDKHFLEVIGETEPRKLYFDIDYYVESNDLTDTILSSVKDLLFEIDLGVPIEESDLAVCSGQGLTKDGQVKKSIHIVVNNIHFKDFADMKKAVGYIKRQVYSNDKYRVLRKGENAKEILDFAVYKSQQVFKLPFQTKAKSNTTITQVPEGACRLEDFLLSHSYGAGRMYQVSHLPAPEQKIQKITCPSAKGKRIEVNWEEGMILQSLRDKIGEDFKSPMSQEKKPMGNGMDSLKYYVKSVPNPTAECSCGQGCGRKVKSAMGYCLSRITENSDEGFEIYWDWLNTSNLSKEKEKALWLKNRTDYGFKWGLLYKLALMYNPRIGGGYNDILDQLFNDKETFPVQSQVINSKYIEHEHFSLEKCLDKNKVVFIKSPMGTGKSYSFKQIFEGNRYKSVCYLSCKRAFASSMSSEFGEYGFVNYDEVSPRENIKDKSRIICSVESAHYLRNAYDLVVIDESESICDNLTGGMIQKNNPVGNITAMHSVIKYSSKVVVMDAYLTTRSFDMIRMITEKKREDCFYLKNEFQFEPRFATMFNGKGCKQQFNARLKKQLQDGRRCVVVMGGKTHSEAIEEMLKTEGISYILHNSNEKNKLPPNADVDTLWSGVQCLIYTPTITAGISYTNPNWIFDDLFIYCVNKGSCHIRDTIQAHRRVRNFASKNVYVCVNDLWRGHESSSMPMVKSECEEYYSHFKQLLYGDDVNCLKSEPETAWVYPIFIHNKIEVNISRILCKKLLERYLKCENIRLIESESEDALDLAGIETVFVYEDIQRLSMEEFQELDERVQDTSSDKEFLSDEEWGKYIKMKFGLEHINPSSSPETLRKFFDNYYSNPQMRRNFRNIREFMKNWEDTKQAWDTFDKTDLFTRDEEKPMELRSSNLKLSQLISKFFIQTKLLADGEPIYQCVNREFWLDELGKPEMKEWCNDINLVPSINNLLSNHKIRPANKIKDTPKGIKAIFENMIKDLWGMELESSDKQVYVEKDGKKKKTRKTKCKLVMMPQGAVEQDEENPNPEKNGAEDIKNGVNRQDPVFHPFNVFRNAFTEFGEKITNLEYYTDYEQTYGDMDEDPIEPGKSIIGTLLDDTDDEEETSWQYQPTDWGKNKAKVDDRKIGMFAQKNRCKGCGKETLNTHCIQCLIKQNAK